ncbi:mechanosensitive ion channel family protein [Methanoplanus endosymbiosus]|uniref:Mechanosensitive ion channel family protein n=1 Tax=Methanoplanus endosymbiosus TaxID=33865 RepID=A0A9E7TKS5_9EURY|nr:mechanosensitive ion channel family protein [Methanoplanus endosymbiosus]UUX91531.1 mechanosensitive ion channel family protein [Methanoplanus endosymbiosus]
MADSITSGIENISLESFDLLNTIIDILYILILAWIVVKISGILLKGLSEKAGQYRIAIAMMIPLSKIFVYAIAIYLIFLQIVGPSLSVLLAFSGLFGAAIGFGLKDVFADILGGIVIIFERPFKIGDKITVGDSYGEVKDIGLRATRIVTPDDSEVSLPNFFIFDRSVSSGNAGAMEMMVVTDIYISPDSDIREAVEIMREAVISSGYVYITKERRYNVLVKNYPYYSRIRAKAYVNDLRYEFEFRSDVTGRAWAEMKRRGIKSPQIHEPYDNEKNSGDEKKGLIDH